MWCLTSVSPVLSGYVLSGASQAFLLGSEEAFLSGASQGVLLRSQNAFCLVPRKRVSPGFGGGVVSSVSPALSGCVVSGASQAFILGSDEAFLCCADGPPALCTHFGVLSL